MRHFRKEQRNVNGLPKTVTVDGATGEIATEAMLITAFQQLTATGLNVFRTASAAKKQYPASGCICQITDEFVTIDTDLGLVEVPKSSFHTTYQFAN
jgi:hypothetical protein